MENGWLARERRPFLNKDVPVVAFLRRERGDEDAARELAQENELGVSETAVRVIVHRLRQRYREAVRAELRQTLVPGASVEEELRCLFTALAA